MTTLKDILFLVASPALTALAIVLLTGCGTQVPPLVESASASYDGAALNSGVVALVPGGQLVTPHWRERYNAMIALYGNRFAPPLQPDDGIVPASTGPAAAGVSAATTYFVDDEHAVKFDQMNEWRKAATSVPAAVAKPSTAEIPASAK
jgi:hypothetical protein